MTATTPQTLAMLSLASLSAAMLLVAGVLIARDVQRHRNARVLARALAVHAQDGEAAPSREKVRRALPYHWLQTRLGRLLVADEDRQLIDQCGLPSARSQLAFLLVRVVLALLLPATAWICIEAGWLERKFLPGLALAFVAGFMLPKFVLGKWAARRREQATDELPLMVDLLRLLQGVGLSLDQSLHIMAADFRHVLKVLGGELVIANRQYTQGRTREQSLQRLSTLHADEDLAALVGLLVQVDRHGGAVQEPLAQFGNRLREARRSRMKARIGKITVKMTGVMVCTLLPALIIVAAGPGFLAVIRSLGAMAK